MDSVAPNDWLGLCLDGVGVKACASAANTVPTALVYNHQASDNRPATTFQLRRDGRNQLQRCAKRRAVVPQRNRLRLVPSEWILRSRYVPRLRVPYFPPWVTLCTVSISLLQTLFIFVVSPCPSFDRTILQTLRPSNLVLLHDIKRSKR